MKLKKIPYDRIITICNSDEMPNIYDVEIGNVEKLCGFHSIECHIVLYPYSRKIDSDKMFFNPFEEYVKDILSSLRSAYVKSESQFGKLFGLIIGLFIAIVFAVFANSEVISIESAVSILGAYFIGKELWDDIERVLMNISRNCRIKYQESYYIYRLERHTTLTNYSYLAKKNRYGTEHFLPDKMDFIQQSNSQTVRMYFRTGGKRCPTGRAAHILSIHIAPDILDDFKNDGFMLGVKLSFNKGFLGIMNSVELFQSINANSIGCLDEHGNWFENALFCRKILRLGKLKYFRRKDLITGKTIVNFEEVDGFGISEPAPPND